MRPQCPRALGNHECSPRLCVGEQIGNENGHSLHSFLDASVVRSCKRAEDELAAFDVLDLFADFFYHPAVLVTHRCGLCHFRDAYDKAKDPIHRYRWPRGE